MDAPASSLVRARAAGRGGEEAFLTAHHDIAPGEQRLPEPSLWIAYLLLAALVAIYFPTLTRMVGHWARISDHSHGFVVAPLAVFFAWEQRRA